MTFTFMTFSTCQQKKTDKMADYKNVIDKNDPLNEIIDKCRTCLGRCENMRFLSPQSDTDKILTSTFNNLTNIEWFQDVAMPHYLCASCEDTLTICHNFRTLCKQSDTAIRSYLQQQLQCETVPALVWFDQCPRSFDEDEKPPLLAEVKSEVVWLEADDRDEATAVSDEIDDDLSFQQELPPRARLAGSRVRLKLVPENQVLQAIEDIKRLKCPCCAFVVNDSSTRNLWTHILTCHREIKHKWCSRCNQIVENLPEHKINHPKVMFACRFCNNKQFIRRHFIRHFKSHLGNREFNCPLCKHHFSTPQSCRLHYAHHFKKRSHHRCPHCNRNYPTVKLLEMHCNSEHGQISCSICQKRFRTEELRVNHECIEGNSSKVTDTASNCYESESIREVGTIDNVTTSHYYEPISEIGTTDKVTTFAPIPSSSLLYPQHFCVICHQWVHTSLTVHNSKFHQKQNGDPTTDVVVKTDRDARPFACPHCPRTFAYKHDFAVHERTHTGEKPFACTVCGKRFTQSSSLGTHMLQHGERNHQCHLCDRKFWRAIQLTLHLRKHAGFKPFLCSECGKTFSQKSHLNDHWETHHSNERPYKCTNCDKTFKNSQLLRTHQLTHLDYKLFKCTICSYGCQRKYRLQQHMKRHNKARVIEKKICQICERGFSTQTLLNAHKSSAHNAIL